MSIKGIVMLEVAAGALAQKEAKTCTLCLSQIHKHVSLEFLVSERSAKGRADIEGCQLILFGSSLADTIKGVSPKQL